MPQRFETAVAYMAVLQLGAVAMPLSMLFGPEALQYRLHDSEAVVAQTMIVPGIAIRRAPHRSMKIPNRGDNTTPSSAGAISAADMSARDQPNSASSGATNTPVA